MKQKKIRRSQAEWTSLVAQQAQSGQTIADFCYSHGLPQNSFMYWRQKLKNKTNTSLNKFITLIPGERVGSTSQLLAPSEQLVFNAYQEPQNVRVRLD